MNPVPQGKSILVLCEGNLCRSPMAAALLGMALGPGFPVASAGLAAREGMPPDPEAVRIMAGQGLDISGLRSRQLSPAMALAAELILVMDPEQRDWCTGQVPSSRGRVFLLGHWRRPGPLAIADPYRRGAEAFRAAFEAIQQCVSDWIPQLQPLQRGLPARSAREVPPLTPTEWAGEARSSRQPKRRSA